MDAPRSIDRRPGYIHVSHARYKTALALFFHNRGFMGKQVQERNRALSGKKKASTGFIIHLAVYLVRIP